MCAEGVGGGGCLISDQRKGGWVDFALTRGTEGGGQNPRYFANIPCICPLSLGFPLTCLQEPIKKHVPNVVLHKVALATIESLGTLTDVAPVFVTREKTIPLQNLLDTAIIADTYQERFRATATVSYKIMSTRNLIMRTTLS